MTQSADAGASSAIQTPLVIEAHGLTRRFGELTAVDNLSLAIPRGSIYGFLGPNGCGKSTAIRLLTGLLLPDAGEVTVLGKPLAGNEERLKQRIGYMTQKFSLYDNLSVLENLRFVASIYGLFGRRGKARIEELLHLYSLEGRESQLAGSMSGGQKQRLALACATLHSPSCCFSMNPPRRSIRKTAASFGSGCSISAPPGPLFWCQPITWTRRSAAMHWQSLSAAPSGPMAPRPN